ncbi:MAG: hypothetical protein QOG31_1312 [Thermoplasmata archaeon]|jgi:hypothetical protein|nr:hypothetical protein [Thermoplasmata archaeon]
MLLLMVECGRFKEALLFAEKASIQLRSGAVPPFLNEAEIDNLKDQVALVAGLVCCQLRNATRRCHARLAWADAALRWFDLLSDRNPTLLRDAVVPNPALRGLRPRVEQLLVLPLGAEVA